MDPKDCGGYGNQVLYRMCREQPHHTDIDVISGKIWLIGRAYTVPIERRAGAFGRKARKARMDLHKFIAPKIASSPLDEWLASVADVRMVSFDNLRSVLLVHFRFVQLLKKLAGLERRSFASKYLHFHQPSAFFIYDFVRGGESGKKSNYACPWTARNTTGNMPTSFFAASGTGTRRPRIEVSRRWGPGNWTKNYWATDPLGLSCTVSGVGLVGDKNAHGLLG